MTAPLPPAAAWQVLLDRHAELFADLDEGARIGVARRDDVNQAGAVMVVWEIEDGKAKAKEQPFPGYQEAKVDVMLVGDDGAMGDIAGELDGDALPALKQLVRKGSFICYVLKRRCVLEAAGYEDVLDSFGVPFLGACR